MSKLKNWIVYISNLHYTRSDLERRLAGDRDWAVLRQIECVCRGGDEQCLCQDCLQYFPKLSTFISSFTTFSCLLFVNFAFFLRLLAALAAAALSRHRELWLPSTRGENLLKFKHGHFNWPHYNHGIYTKDTVHSVPECGFEGLK